MVQNCAKKSLIMVNISIPDERFVLLITIKNYFCFSWVVMVFSEDECNVATLAIWGSENEEDE
jgi:hypothetical protein